MIRGAKKPGSVVTMLPRQHVKLPEYLLDCREISKSEYMSHRKKEHKEKVPNCKNGNNGGCHFGHGKCWFIHNDIQNDNIEDSSENKNKNEDRNDIMQKLVEMFERQTERIILLENSINPRNQSKCS